MIKIVKILTFTLGLFLTLGVIFVWIMIFMMLVG